MLNNYPYLYACLIGAAVFILFFLSIRKQRKLMITSGLMSLPLFPLAILYENVYWAPVRLGGLALGIEDIIFAFTSAGYAWLFFIWPFRHKTMVDFYLPRFIKRYIILMIFFITIFISLLLLGIDVMTSTISLHILIVILMLFIHKQLWLPALTSAIIYGLIYSTFVLILFWIWPEFLSQWNVNIIWARKIMGLPIGEVLWAASYGASWPLFVWYALNASLTDKLQLQTQKR